jgi:ectoine hydroxylase
VEWTFDSLDAMDQIAAVGAAVRLSDATVAEFHREGFMFFPNVFAADEVELLRREAHAIFELDRQEVWRESTGVARTAFAAQTYNEAYRRLGAHPRLIAPVEQLLGGRLYMHQFKINAKAAFDGEVWQWHQDYGTWQRDDAMPEPLAMNIAIFLDDVTAVNGPLFLIPGSHAAGVQAAGHDLATTSYPLWTLGRETVRTLAEAGGIVAPLGKAGSMLMFHSNLVHASPPNISPFGRTIVYLSLCRTDNHIRKFARKAWIAHRDFTPIEALADDCLRELAQTTAPPPA